MELTRFQKILLAVLAGMLVLSGAALAVFRTHPGVLFEESLLKITRYERQVYYSGRAHGTPVTIAVTWPADARTVVDFTIGTEIHDVCEVDYPLGEIPTEDGFSAEGIRITKNGAVLFEGGYDREDGYWFDRGGKFQAAFGIRFGAVVTGDPWYGYETTAADAVRFALGPETAAHGDPALFAMASFCTLLLAVGIVFHRQFFLWRHWGARDPEPTEGYLALERAGWVLCTAVLAVCYCVALYQIY